jgi:hypothetical protein
MTDIFADLPEEPKENALSVHVNKITKLEIAKVATDTIRQVNDGERDALEVIIQAKAITQVAEAIIEGVKGSAVDEAHKYDKMDRVYHGVPFVIKALPHTWGFDHCEEWAGVVAEQERLSNLRKKIERKMVNAYHGVDEFFDDGTPVPAAVIAKHKGETIEIQIPKK